MRVALISRAAFPYHGHGGLERHVASLFKYLRRAGCDVTLFTTPVTSKASPAEGVRIVAYGGLPWPKRRGFVVLDRDTNYLAWSLRAGKQVHDERFDVVQADGGAAFGYAFSASDSSAPLVIHPHGMEEFKAPPLKRTAYLPLRSATRFAARRAAVVLAPDASMKHEVVRYLGVPDDRVEVQPNAIDVEALDATPREALDRFRLGGAPVLLSVGRLETNKGFDVLARALAPLRDRAFSWILVGEGPRRSGLERTVQNEGLADRTVFAGPVSEGELAALYDRAAVFVHPTLYEGSSMVTLEAMAHRKPVIASAVGGIPDKIADGETGRLLPPNDDHALTAAIDEVLSMDRGARAAWGDEARAIVEVRFDWKTRAKELIELYERLLPR